MDGISGPAAGQVALHFFGRDYLIGPVTLADFGTVERYLLAHNRRDVLHGIVTACGPLPASLLREQWERARGRLADVLAVPERELLAWLNTVDGVTFLLWLLLDRTDPGARTIAAVRREFNSLPESSQTEVIDAVIAAASLDLVGKTLERRTRRNRNRTTPPTPAGPGRKERREKVGSRWDELFWRLTLPGEAGGRGFAPSEVRGMTLYEALLYAADESAVTGREKLTPAEARNRGLIPPSKKKRKEAP